MGVQGAAVRWVGGLALGWCGCANSNDPEEMDISAESRTIEQTVNGEVVQRRYTVHTPLEWDGTPTLPVLFAFHGGGGEGHFFTEQLNESMHANPFMGIYPEALDEGWHLGDGPSLPNDAELVELILDELSTTPGVDATAAVAHGFSNGAAFVHGLVQATDRIAAISAAASQLREANQPKSGDPQPSVLQLHGTEDRVIEYEGSSQQSGGDEAFLAAEDSAAVWAAHNGCDPTPIEAAAGEHTRFEWPGCLSGTRVVHYRLNGVGHDMPWDVEDDTFATIVDFLLAARP